MPSVHDSLHDVIVGIVADCGLMYLGAALQVRKRKQPLISEGVDPAPAVYATPSELPGSDEPFDTEGYRLRGRRFQVVLAVPSNLDNLSYLPEHGEWRQLIHDAFGPVEALDEIEEILSWELTPGPVIDRTAWPAGYDYDSVLGLNVFTVELP